MAIIILRRTYTNFIHSVTLDSAGTKELTGRVTHAKPHSRVSAFRNPAGHGTRGAWCEGRGNGNRFPDVPARETPRHAREMTAALSSPGWYAVAFLTRNFRHILWDGLALLSRQAGPCSAEVEARPNPSERHDLHTSRPCIIKEWKYSDPHSICVRCLRQHPGCGSEWNAAATRGRRGPTLGPGGGSVHDCTW